MNAVQGYKNLYLERVRERLETEGAEVELVQLERLSPAEVDLLVLMERGWGPQIPRRTQAVNWPAPQAVDSTELVAAAPSPPQATRAAIAWMNDDDRLAS